MTLGQVFEIAKSYNYAAMELIYDGSSEDNSNPRSYVYRVGSFCIKYYIRTLQDCITEYENLKKLEPYGFAPKVYCQSKEQRFIIMEFIEGIPWGKLREPTPEQESQLDTIKRQLDEMGIYYEKEKIHCLVELSGKVRFIDFNI